ncbi:MAG: threonine/serine exporter ThrE family protein [Lachnospirales bacterium]
MEQLYNNQDIVFFANRELKIAIEIGELMLMRGSETTRVENTIDIILNNSGLCTECDSLVQTTGIFITITDTSGNSHTMIKRISSIRTDLDSIAQLNNLSRLYVSKAINYEEACEMFKNIENIAMYPKHIEAFFSALTCLFFGYMIFLSPVDAFGAFLAGFFAHSYGLYVIDKHIDTQFMRIIFTSMLIGICSIIISVYLPNSDINSIMIGSIMPLVPGTETVTGVRDLVEGNFLAAIARLLNAVLIGISIAVGIGIILAIYMYLGGTI